MINHSPCKHKELNLILRSQVKKLSLAVCDCYPKAGEADPWPASLASLLWKLQASKTSCFKNKVSVARGRTPKEWFPSYLLNSAFTCVLKWQAEKIFPPILQMSPCIQSRQTRPPPKLRPIRAPRGQACPTLLYSPVAAVLRWLSAMGIRNPKLADKSLGSQAKPHRKLQRSRSPLRRSPTGPMAMGTGRKLEARARPAHTPYHGWLEGLQVLPPE